MVRRTYTDELAGLPTAYSAALSVPESDIEALRADLAGAPAVFVAAGGAFAAAKFAAELHERFCGSLARVATPLEIVSRPPADHVTIILISARARHPDTAAAARAVLKAGIRRIVLVTQRPPDELTGSLADPAISHHHLPVVHGYDGFLATGSVLVTATVMARAYASATNFPLDLPGFNEAILPDIRQRILVLSTPDTSAIGYDIEARFNETGLADVELADYRNFAHGRHYGLSRRINETTIVALSAVERNDIAEKTIKFLPPESQVVQLHSNLSWPASTLDLFVRSAKLVDRPAAHAKLDPAKPHVPQYGRRLYHLGSVDTAKGQREPVLRKVSEAIEGGPANALYGTYADALEAWHNAIHQVKISGIILDYDGTVCATAERFHLPNSRVQAQILRLLRAGVPVGFATGRGKSLYRDLRQWIPSDLWNHVHLGLYNGSLRLRLSEPVPLDSEEPPEDLQAAHERLNAAEFSNILIAKLRKHQLSVEPSGKAYISQPALCAMVGSVLARPPRLEVNLLMSGHSLDIIQSSDGKTRVYDDMKCSVTSGDIIAIGDQGQLGGNDHELLAVSPHTLSVDRCSADPTRCWNLLLPSERGPDGLVQYLNALKITGSNLRFRWGYT